MLEQNVIANAPLSPESMKPMGTKARSSMSGSSQVIHGLRRARFIKGDAV